MTHPLLPSPLNKTLALQKQKANSYYHHPPPALRIEIEDAQKYATSGHSSPQHHNSLTLFNTKHDDPSNSDVQTTVSKWLATSQTFDKAPIPPPTPEPIADPVVQHRRGEEYWLQLSRSLDLRIKARSEHWRQLSRSLDLRIKAQSAQSKAAIYLDQGSRDASTGIKNSTPNPQSQDKLARSAENTAAGQLNTALPPLRNVMGSSKKQERERKGSIETDMSIVQEKLEKFKREQEKQEHLQAQKFKKADEAVKAKAKKLTADAMAAHKDQERKKYVEGRAQDIHENLVQCKPFDMDAARREFSEKEVQDIKKIVRGLGFAKK